MRGRGVDNQGGRDIEFLVSDHPSGVVILLFLFLDQGPELGLAGHRSMCKTSAEAVAFAGERVHHDISKIAQRSCDQTGIDVASAQHSNVGSPLG